MKKKRINSILIVAEKGKAAERIALILSEGKAKRVSKRGVKIYFFNKGGINYFVLGLKGHIFTAEFSKKVHEKGWESIDPLYLLTKAPLSKVVRKESRDVLKILKSLVRKVDEIIIATDYDREGENIGMQVADMVAKKIKKSIIVRRAKFSSLTSREIRKAFDDKNLIDLNINMVNASEVRQEIDLRMGVSFTRLATMSIQRSLNRPDFPMISIGPCQTPTLALVVKRYIEHLKSLEEAEEKKTYRVKIEAVNGNDRLVFELKKDFKKYSEAKRFVSNLAGKYVEVVDIRKNEKKIPRPLPLNTVRLASLAARTLGMSPRDTLMVAEKLYLEGFISYPRTETDRYSRYEESMLKSLFIEAKNKKIIPIKGDYRGPRNGKRDDGAHPPIRPERVVKFNKIKASLKFERDRAVKLYELILRHFLANLMDNAIIEEIRVEAKIYGNEKLEASSTIYNIIERGFLEVYPYHPLAQSLKRTKSPQIGSKWKIEKLEIFEKYPPIKEPISESELVKLMEKLGIGTDATFADHIHKIIQRKYVEKKRGRLIPTELGLALYEALKASVPKVIDPNIRADMEQWFYMVERGEMDPRMAVKQAIETFSEMLINFRKNISVFVNTVKRAILSMGINSFLKPRSRFRNKSKKRSKKKRRRR